MALNRFLSTETGSVKVEVTNPILNVDGSAATIPVELDGYDINAGSTGPKTLRVVVSSSQAPIASNVTDIDNNTVSRQAGNVEAGTQRVTLATDDANLAAINTSSAQIANQDPQGILYRSGSGAYTTVPMRGSRDAVTTNFQSLAFAHPSDLKYWRNVNNQTVAVVSTSLNDVGPSGTGARSVFGSGIDANGDRQTATVNLNGQTEVTLFTGVSLDILRVVTAGGGSAGTGNLGVISAIRGGIGASVGGVPSTPTQVFATIDVGRNLADMPYYSIPPAINYYPGELTVATDTNMRLQVICTAIPYGGAVGDNVPRIEFEALLNRNMTADLRHLGPWTSGCVHIVAQAVSGTANISFALTGWTEESGWS